MPIPKEIADAPVLFDGLYPFLEDYTLLMRYAGTETIKLSEVMAFAEFEGMGKDYLADLLAYIPALEAVRMEYLREKAKEEAEKNT